MKKPREKTNKKIRVQGQKLCTECNHPYGPISAHTDIRCANCGNHQNPILALKVYSRGVNEGGRIS